MNSSLIWLVVLYRFFLSMRSKYCTIRTVSWFEITCNTHLGCICPPFARCMRGISWNVALFNVSSWIYFVCMTKTQCDCVFTRLSLCVQSGNWQRQNEGKAVCRTSKNCSADIQEQTKATGSNGVALKPIDPTVCRFICVNYVDTSRLAAQLSIGGIDFFARTSLQKTGDEGVCDEDCT